MLSQMESCSCEQAQDVVSAKGIYRPSGTLILFLLANRGLTPPRLLIYRASGTLKPPKILFAWLCSNYVHMRLITELHQNLSAIFPRNTVGANVGKADPRYDIGERGSIPSVKIAIHHRILCP